MALVHYRQVATILTTCSTSPAGPRYRPEHMNVRLLHVDLTATYQDRSFRRPSILRVADDPLEA